MSIYAVYEPPLRAHESAPNPERFVFVRDVSIVVSILLAVLVRFEAATLRRFTLWRRGWRNVGIVVGDDLESAERRFFDAWVYKTSVEKAHPGSGASPPAWGAPLSRRTSPEVIGLFPQSRRPQ